jgi:hypothetical protein
MDDGGTPPVSTYEDPNPGGIIPGTGGAFAPCYVAPDFPSRFGGTHFPHLTKDP